MLTSPRPTPHPLTRWKQWTQAIYVETVKNIKNAESTFDEIAAKFRGKKFERVCSNQTQLFQKNLIT